MKIDLPQVSLSNKIIWVANSKGKRTIKSFYLLDRDRFQVQGGNQSLQKKLWKLPVYERFRIFIWRLANSILPWPSNEDPCPMCKVSSDSVEHLFRDCVFYELLGGTRIGSSRALLSLVAHIKK